MGQAIIPPQPPTSAEIRDLKRLVAGIVRSQGNRFIKELMRDLEIPLGANKDDLEHNLSDAIANGSLRFSDVEAWLEDVEGWGNQHVYLYGLPSSVKNQLSDPKLKQAVGAAGLNDFWNASTVMEFPDDPELTSISFESGVLRVVWQEASPGWTPVPDKNYQEQEDLDLYEYRAHRKIERRAITRFEVHKALGLAALFIADPIQGDEHKTAIDTAKAVIAQLLDLSALEARQLDISVVSRNMDQQNVPTNANPTPDIKTQKTRLVSGGSYVEFAADSREKGYAEEAAVRDVRKAIKPAQLIEFQASTGVFVFRHGSGGGSIARDLRVQLYGRGNRIRLWAQMKSEEVWAILTEVATYTGVSP